MAAKSLLSKADVRMLLCMILTLVGAFLIVTGRPMPDAFIGIWGTSMGYYFAGKENGETRTYNAEIARAVSMRGDNRG